MSEIKKLTIGQDELDLSKYTPNDATLTIQQNGTTVDTFTANSSANKTVNIETIYSEDVSSTQPIAQVVSTAMIQDEAVTTAKIDDGAVTVEKIDLSSVGGTLQYVARFPINKRTYNNGYAVFNEPIVYLQTDNNISITRYNSNLFLRLDLPTDKQYVTKIETQLWTPQNSWDYILVELRKNGSGFARAMAPKINGSRGFVATHGWQNVVNADYISEYINTTGNNYSDGNMSERDTYIEIEIFCVS